MTILVNSLNCSTVKEYQSRFEQLLANVGYLPPPRQVSCFVSGLKESIKADVLVGRPLDLTTAIVARTNPITSKEGGVSRSPMPIQRLSPAELKEWCDKGLLLQL